MQVYHNPYKGQSPNENYFIPITGSIKLSNKLSKRLSKNMSDQDSYFLSLALDLTGIKCYSVINKWTVNYNCYNTP